MPAEECVQFSNPSGSILRGILHHGNPSEYKGASVICLNTGLNDMSGWHRLQVKIARFLAEQGYNVLRFDDQGIGDSEGELEEESIVKIFASIERGLFVSNADAAVDFIGERFKGERPVYLGFCGGGLTAIHSAAYNEKVAGVIDIAGPVTLSSKEYLDKKDPWEVRRNITEYRSKLLQLGPWLRFISGKGEYRTVFQSLIYYVKHKVKGMYSEGVKGSNVEDCKNLNSAFFHSFKAYARSKRPILFYYAEVDSSTWEFKKYFLSPYKDSKFWSPSSCRFIEVEKENHIFARQESQERMKADISNWLRDNFR